MSLEPQSSSGFWLRKRACVPAEESTSEAASPSGLDDLRARLNHWGQLWSVESEANDRSYAQRLVAERLTRWLERCFGQHAPRSLRGKDDCVSLASSMPVLTAFLGRRATRELSRRILQDI
jgi:hypothetical protein